MPILWKAKQDLRWGAVAILKAGLRRESFSSVGQAETVVMSGGLHGKIEIGGKSRVYAVQRLTACYGVANFLVQVDAGTLIHWRTGEAGDPRQLQVIDSSDPAVADRCDSPTESTYWYRLGIDPLGADNGLHFLERTTGVEDVTRQSIALAAAYIRIEFEYPARQLQGLLTQV